MARCHTCRKYLGIGLFSRWVTLDRERFCAACAEEYFQQRRARVLEEIQKGGQPQVIFMVNRVRTKNPDRPSSRERLVGQVAFTNKGICFIQMGQHLAADPGMEAALGLIGRLVAERAASKAKRRALEEAEELAAGARDVPEMMARARQVVFYPLDQVRRLKFDSRGFDVWYGKVRKRFAFEGGRKAYRLMEDQAVAYAGDIARGVRPSPLPGMRLRSDI